MRDFLEGGVCGFITGAAAAGGVGVAAGKNTCEGVVLLSCLLSTNSAPWWFLIICMTVDMPNPRPVNFVVKKGSKRRFSVSSFMPQVITSSTTKRPGSGLSSKRLEE